MPSVDMASEERFARNGKNYVILVFGLFVTSILLHSIIVEIIFFISSKVLQDNKTIMDCILYIVSTTLYRYSLNKIYFLRWLVCKNDTNEQLTSRKSIKHIANSKAEQTRTSKEKVGNCCHGGVSFPCRPIVFQFQISFKYNELWLSAIY